MVKAVFMKVGSGLLAPADPAAEAMIQSMRIGEEVALDAKKARNARFHRKFFALLGLAFDAWEPAAGQKEYRGHPIQKDKDRFREEMLILAGHYDAVFSTNGEIRLVARSISFATCDEAEFQKIYSQVLNVVWDKIMRHSRYRSPEEVDAVVSRLLSFGN